MTRQLVKSPSKRNLKVERSLAILALINLGLVLFDLSYISLRNFYFREFPSLTKLYDPIKGIEPNRDTERYLDTVEQLEKEVVQAGLTSPNVEKRLQEIRALSTEMIDTNPFEVANKTGTLEQIKNRMRSHIFNDRKASSKQSFELFWSQQNLQSNYSGEIAFYNKKIKPLIASNYFRQIGENGDFVENFWLIDLGFTLLFFTEFLARTYTIHRRHVNLSWMEAMLWRWYDIFLFLPVFRWLRVIPVAIRLNQAELLNLNPIQAQINQGFVANFAEELTEVVVVRIITQAQTAIRNGEISRWLSQRDVKPYIDLNNTNEVEAIASLLWNLTICQVLPKIRPDIEALLRYNIEKILNQSPAYRGLTQIPGLGQIPSQLTDQLVHQISEAAYNTLNSTLEVDPVAVKLTEQLMTHFSEAIATEVQKKQTLQKVQSLITDLLEEVKINYVEKLSQEDLDAIIEQTRAIRHITHNK